MTVLWLVFWIVVIGVCVMVLKGIGLPPPFVQLLYAIGVLLALYLVISFVEAHGGMGGDGCGLGRTRVR